jgi:hypothetical protein
MKVRFAILFFSSLLVVELAQGGGLSDIYVKKDCHDDRIEFLSDGRYYDNGSRQWGTYTVEKDECACRRGDEEQFRFVTKGRILIDADDHEWVPREDLAKMPWKDLSPVTIVVLDRDTRRPIPRFAYTYEINAPEGTYDPLWVRAKEVRSATGEFQLLAPKSCQISVQIEGEGIVSGYGRNGPSGGDYALTSENKPRRIEVAVSTGMTLEGVVVAKSGKPIPGALVSPGIVSVPMLTTTPDRDRGVKTDADGKFTLRGANSTLNVCVSHPDYFECGGAKFEKIGKTIGENRYFTRIEMAPGEKFFGAVKDSAGKPLAGVTVSDGEEQKVQTQRDGTFVLALKKSATAYELSFEKDSYVKQILKHKWPDPKGFSVTLESQPVLAGRVLAADGRPVERFLVAAGIGREPSTLECTRENVRDAQGRFSLWVDTSDDWAKVGKVWVGIKSPGFALWDKTVDTWKGELPLVAQLTPGVSVYGSLAGRGRPAGTVSVTLSPCRAHDDPSDNGEFSKRQEFGQMQTTVGSAGTFRFDHVVPGDYLLLIAGPAISPIGVAVNVSSKDVNLGEFRPAGTGSICGVFYMPARNSERGKCRPGEKRSPGQFVAGHVYLPRTSSGPAAEALSCLDSIAFRTDEQGRFHVGGVPIGVVGVEVPYSISGDFASAYTRRAVVVEGKTTEVRFFDPSGDWDVNCKPRIGDGSLAQRLTGTGEAAKRRVEDVTTRPPRLVATLELRGHVPGLFGDSLWTEMKGDERILVADVPPGKYHLVVEDWQGEGSRAVVPGIVYEQDVETVNGGTTLTVPLGAGSITGGVRWSKPYRCPIHVIALGKKTVAIRHAYCDEEGNFCVRYLPADDYTLVAHDHGAGWCKLAETAVKDNTTDIGMHLLAPGGAIIATLPARWAADQSVAVTAVDSQGILIEHPVGDESEGKTVAYSNLWPGKWTVRLTKDDRVIVEKAVALRGTETIICDLTGP